MKYKKPLLIVILIGFGSAVAFGYSNYWRTPKIAPAAPPATDAIVIISPGQQFTAEIQPITDEYEAVGTIRPRTETRIESQITALVREVKVKPGSDVARGQILVVLDNRQFSSRLDQARQGHRSSVAGRKQGKQAIAAAQAAFDQAQKAYQRTKKYHAAQAATTQQLEKTRAAFLQAQAGLEQAKEALVGIGAGINQASEVVREAKIALGFAQIKAPAAGQVLKRLVEPGDLAHPGKPLLIMRTSGVLRLEAHVREGLIARVKPGMVLNVTIDTLKKTVEARVEEIIPYADPQTRTFLVKAALPEIEGIFPGMFAKLRIPVRTHEVVVIPRRAVVLVGQLETVVVNEQNGWKRRFIKTGRIIGDTIEILAGLSGGETVGY